MPHDKEVMKFKYRKIIVILAMVWATYSLARWGILDGGNVVAIFCTALTLFNGANAIEHLAEKKQ